jgi:hypothetical protein
MGAWGIGVFDNDTACDWADDLAETDDLSVVEASLEKVLSSGADYLEAPDAEEALAAAEVVARLQGNTGDSDAYTEAIDTWVSEHKLFVSAALAKKTLTALERILLEPSELLELWGESDEFDAWKTDVENLKSRIRVQAI